jgi:hypothetical protein
MQFVKAVVALHDKYLDFVETCFQSNTLFHKVIMSSAIFLYE